MKRRDDRAWVKNAMTIQGGPQLARMLREIQFPKGVQNVRKIWAKKEAGQ